MKLTAGSIRNRHLNVRAHLDLFPKDCYGRSRRSAGEGAKFELELDGLETVISTDFGVDEATGKPRGFVRDRSAIGRFYDFYQLQPGAEIVLRRLSSRRFRLSVLRRRLRAAEFFAGIGLVRLALTENGFDVVYANDIDPDKREMYLANFPEDAFQLGDIKKVDATDIPSADLYTASFPCTDLSIAGAMRGIHSGESSMFWEFIRILRERGGARPRAILLENVPGFLMSNGGKDFEAAIAALNELGYTCDAVMLDAARFVPQSRLRLFVVGHLSVEPEMVFGLTESVVRPKPLADFILSHPHLRWRIAPMPDLPDSKPRLEQIVENLPDDNEHWWNSTRTEYFMGQLSARHAKAAAEMIRGTRVTYATAFRRVRHGRSMAELRTDGIAGCLRTPKGGSGRQILFKAGNGRYQVRLLTPRECARLQGVPDSYVINLPLNRALFGFGDAVCVPVVGWIVRNLVAPALACNGARDMHSGVSNNGPEIG